jgi:hypothetical protein
METFRRDHLNPPKSAAKRRDLTRQRNGCSEHTAPRPDPHPTMVPSARAGGRAGKAAPGSFPVGSRNGPISWDRCRPEVCVKCSAHVTTPDAPRPDQWIRWLSQSGDTGSNPDPTGKHRVSAAELGFSQSRATMWWYLAGFTSMSPPARTVASRSATSDWPGHRSGPIPPVFYRSGVLLYPRSAR